MTDKTLANEDTDTSEQSQAQEKFYSQKEFDDHMARLKSSLARKYEKQYADLGDPEELRNLKAEAEKRKTDELKKRGEFETVLKELADRKDQEIRKRDEIIKNYTVDMPLINAAAQFKSVNPEQVKALLRPRVRLNEGGEVEVLDDRGSPRYNDSGQPLRVEDLVKEFLDSNPHFVQATPGTTHSRSNIAGGPDKLDITKLDMKNPEHRKLYKDAMSKR